MSQVLNPHIPLDGLIYYITVTFSKLLTQTSFILVPIEEICLTVYKNHAIFLSLFREYLNVLQLISEH
jgi:hypothetical protein